MRFFFHIFKYHGGNYTVQVTGRLPGVHKHLTFNSKLKFNVIKSQKRCALEHNAYYRDTYYGDTLKGNTCSLHFL